MASKRIMSVSEFIGEVNALAPCPSPGNLAAFRGQSDATWPLIPGIVRPPFDVAQSLCRAPEDQQDKSAERRLILEFRNYAYPHLPQWVWLGSEIEIKWKQIIVAQHYRLPTRLLDWTTNPLVALFFAVEETAEKCGHREPCPSPSEDGNHCPAVLVLTGRDTFSTDSLARHNSSPPLYGGEHDPGLIRPPDIDRRIAAQGALFSISSDPSAPIPPDDKILIETANCESLLRELDMLGISRKTLFPDLEGISNYLKWSGRYWEPNPGYLP